MTGSTAGAGVAVEEAVVELPQADKSKNRLRVKERIAVFFFMVELLSLLLA
jgi:hypothetical protein